MTTHKYEKTTEENTLAFWHIKSEFEAGQESIFVYFVAPEYKMYHRTEIELDPNALILERVRFLTEPEIELLTRAIKTSAESRFSLEQFDPYSVVAAYVFKPKELIEPEHTQEITDLNEIQIFEHADYFVIEDNKHEFHGIVIPSQFLISSHYDYHYFKRNF
ncbi:hypothetical protein HR060_17795 [Catenovulum sp. SM1970]|uniref:hypothetical protein n=1 Tax=Marinifaba aquimaris TaxID=2741323 RepID=UPI001574B9EE|nr:hypothetical protein [Marinifaba aquimaris]NTS78699.1 hypothetical protein [Marinifaba aquimaris]